MQNAPICWVVVISVQPPLVQVGVAACTAVAVLTVAARRHHLPFELCGWIEALTLPVAAGFASTQPSWRSVKQKSVEASVLLIGRRMAAFRQIPEDEAASARPFDNVGPPVPCRRE